MTRTRLKSPNNQAGLMTGIDCSSSGSLGLLSPQDLTAPAAARQIRVCSSVAMQ